MSHADKSALYQELKAAGVAFDRQYREYTTAELQNAVDKLHQVQGDAAEPADPQISWEEYNALMTGDDQVTLPDNYAEQTARPQYREPEPPHPPPAPTPPPGHVPEFHPDTDAGIRLNTAAEGEVLGVDENGFSWFQYEVRKPSFPQPRARRVLKYIDNGTKMQTVQNGQFIETFEVSGDQHRESEARITLPSYQVGVYKDPRFPFKIHVYNDLRGFDFFDVQEFYGGADLVPIEIKRMYVENVLCYDIRTTVRAIEAEARRLDLMRGTR